MTVVIMYSPPWEEVHMNEEKNGPMGEINALGWDILQHYPGKCVVYSEDEKRVIGVGDDWEEAMEQAEASGVKGQWHTAYAERSDENGA